MVVASRQAGVAPGEMRPVMLDRGYRDTNAFGQRRAGQERSVPQPDPPHEGGSEPMRPVGSLGWALRTAALAGFAAVLATQYLVRLSAPGEVTTSRTALVSVFPAEPETTGSIGRAAPAPSPAKPEAPLAAARTTRLDPCSLSGTAQPRL